MSSSIKKNLGLQTAFQIVNTCLPLITAPYLSRVLGATALGVYSFTSSVVLYFTLFAMLGTVNYGTRTIAAAENNIEERSKSFWSIFCLQLIATTICSIAYLVYLLFFCKDYLFISLLQGLAIIACFFDISWLYFGVEEFKITVVRSMVIKIITVLLIICFVRNSDDLWLYTFIMLMGTLASQLVLWVYLPRYINVLKISITDVLIHIKPNIVLFIPLLAMSVYHIMDKTMLGVLSSYEQNGYYYNADKLINIPLCIINGFGTVLLPRMTALYNSKKIEEANSLLLISLEGVALVSIAMSCGIAAISNEFVPFFFGDGYEDCIVLTIVLSPVLVIKGFTNTIRTQYLVPLKKEQYYINSVICGAATNLVLNLMLIPRLGAMGAVIGTLLAEFVACLVQFFVLIKNFDLRNCIKNCLFYSCAGIVMFFVVRVLSIIDLIIPFKLLMEVLVGGIVFITLTGIIIYRTKSQIYKEVFATYFDRIFKTNSISKR